MSFNLTLAEETKCELKVCDVSKDEELQILGEPLVSIPGEMHSNANFR